MDQFTVAKSEKLTIEVSEATCASVLATFSRAGFATCEVLGFLHLAGTPELAGIARTTTKDRDCYSY